MDEEMLLPTEVAIRISKHRFFIFEIYRLIQKELTIPVTFGDFLEFLDTNYREVLVFKSTKRPPRKWLTKLIQTEEGVQLLNYFGVYYGDPMECFSYGWKKEEKWESREIEKIFDVSVLEREEAADVKTEELLDLGILDENDLIESVTPSDDAEITDDIIATVNEYVKKLNELSVEDEATDNLIREKNISDRKGDDMNKPMSNVGGQDNSEIITEKDRNSFLTKIKTLLKISDNSIFKEKFGEEEIGNFRETGIISEKWKIILREAGFGDFLGIRDNNDVPAGEIEGASAPEKNEGEPSPAKRVCTRVSEDGLIPKKIAKLAMPKILAKAGFKSKKELVLFWGLSSNSHSLIERGIMRLRVSYVELVAKKAGIERDEFFKAVGLGYLVKTANPEKIEPEKPTPSGVDSIAKEETTPDDKKLYASNWMAINQVIQLALFRAGGISNEGIRKEFFLGYLVRQLAGYCVESVEDENKICIKALSPNSIFKKLMKINYLLN